MKIFPAILSDSVETIQAQVNLAKECPGVEKVQIDIVDGFFADNITVSPLNLLEVDFGDLEIDLHLMIDEPMDILQEIESLEENLPIRTIIAQIERMTHQQDFIDDVRKMEYKVGFSLDGFTPVDALDEGILEQLDVIQFMGIEAGYQGQTFLPYTQEKLKNFFSTERRLTKAEVFVDGGVTPEIAKNLAQQGVDGVAVGSSLWSASDFGVQYQHFLDMGNQE